MNIQKGIFSLILLLATLALSSCGGGGGSSGSSGAFSVSPSNLTFSAQVGESTPSSQTISISPNSASTIVPDIIASGNAIDFGSDSSCVGGNNANLACTRTGSDIVVTVSVPDPDILGSGSHTGSILIQSSEHTVTVNVSYIVAGATPVISQVSPYISEVGQTHTVTIRGGGFSNFGTSTPNVSFGATAASNVTLINDSTITVDIPASLSAGVYNISVSGAPVSFSSTAKLVVINTPSYTAQSIALASVPRLKYVYDDERQLLFAANAIDRVLEKYTYNGTTWNSTPATLAMIGIADMVLSTDGATLFVVKHDNKVYEIDPDTLTLRSAVDVKTFRDDGCSGDDCLDTAAISSDGDGVFLDSNQFREIYFYNAETNTSISSPDAGYEDNTISIWNAKLYRSHSGDRILIDGSSNDYIFNSVQKNVSLISGVDVNANPKAINSDGRVIITGTSILKDSGSGYISYATLPITPSLTAVSRDGNKAYIYNGTVLKVYDISTPTVTQVGADITLVASPGTLEEMIVTANGNAAFIAGVDNIVVVPIP